MRDASEFDDFYRSTSRRLLGYAYAVTKDWTQAQDLVQEAYLRAWRDWGRLSRYEDPEAWLRLVVTRLATDVWRRLVRRRAAYERTAASHVDSPPPGEDTMLVTQALLALPERQRQAITLHYLFDLPVSRIAEDLSVAEGTVKSWLSRGRVALAGLLDPDNERRLPTGGDVRAAGDRRTRRRTVAGTAAAAVLLVTGLVWAVQAVRNDGPPPLTPSPSPSLTQELPSPSPTPSAPPEGLPVGDNCDDRYLRRLPIALFPGAGETELCFTPKPDAGQPPQRDHMPRPCPTMEYASDALIDDRRGFDLSAEEGTDTAPSPTTYSQSVTKYRTGGADAYFNELREAMTRCGPYTEDGVRYDFTVQNRLGAGDERLVIQRNRHFVVKPEVTPQDANFLIVVQRVGDYVIVVFDQGWEGSPSKDATITKAVDQAIVAVKAL